MTFGVIVFIILVAGVYFAVRELASAELRKVTTARPSIAFPMPSSTLVPQGPLTACPSPTTTTPGGFPSTPIYTLCKEP